MNDKSCGILRESFEYHKKLADDLFIDGVFPGNDFLVENMCVLIDFAKKEFEAAKAEGIADSDPRLDCLADLLRDILNQMVKMGIEIPYWGDDLLKISRN